MIEIIIGICLLCGVGVIGQKTLAKKVEDSWKKSLPSDGVYRTAMTFKKPDTIIKGVTGVKMREPMKYSTKRSILIVCNCIFISAMVMTAGMFWSMMNSPFAFASVTVILILSFGSIALSISMCD